MITYYVLFRTGCRGIFIGLLQSTFIFICYITDSFMGSRRSYKTDIPTGKQI